MEIQSNNPVLKEQIVALGKVLEDNGAWFSKNLALIDDNGSLSFQVKKPMSTRDPIMKVPQKLFIPQEHLNVSVKGDEFFLNPDMDKLTDVQVDIAKRIFDIYNLTDKVKLHRDESPWIKFKGHPELLSELSAARTANESLQSKQAYLMGLPDAMEDDEFTCWSFLQTRVLGQKTDSGGRVQVLMPFIDYINHDSYAYPFVIRGKNEAERVMSILNAQPYHTTQECFVTYGVYDTLDTFMSYGFPDVSAPFVRSIPLEVKLDGVGTMQFKAMSGMKNDKDVPKQLSDLTHFLPIVNRESDDRLVVSHIFIPIDKTPHGLRRILQAAVRTFYGKDATREQVVDAVYSIEEQIVAANIRFYTDLLADVERSSAPDDLKNMIAFVCNVQRNKLSKYMFKHDFFQMPATMGSGAQSGDEAGDEVNDQSDDSSENVA